MKKRYSYCLLRYRHDPVSEEFVNLGVLVCSPEHAFVGFRTAQRFGRLKAFFGKGEIDSDLKGTLNRCSLEFLKIAKEWNRFPLLSRECSSATEIAKRVVPVDDSALVWSGMSGGFSADLNSTLDSLYTDFIGRFEGGGPTKSRDNKQVWKESVGRIFDAENVTSRLCAKEIEAPLDSYCFDYGWKNGQWHLFEPVSLDLVEADSIQDKALRWSARSNFLRQSPEPHALYLILGQPRDEAMRKAYQRARDILFRSEGVEIVEEESAEAFAREYARKIKEHLEMPEQG